MNHEYSLGKRKIYSNFKEADFNDTKWVVYNAEIWTSTLRSTVQAFISMFLPSPPCSADEISWGITFNPTGVFCFDLFLRRGDSWWTQAPFDHVAPECPVLDQKCSNFWESHYFSRLTHVLALIVFTKGALVYTMRKSQRGLAYVLLGDFYLMTTFSFI